MIYWKIIQVFLLLFTSSSNGETSKLNSFNIQSLSDDRNLLNGVELRLSAYEVII